MRTDNNDAESCARSHNDMIIVFGAVTNHIDDLVHGCSNPSKLAMKLLHSYTKPSLYSSNIDDVEDLLWNSPGRLYSVVVCITRQ